MPMPLRIQSNFVVMDGAFESETVEVTPTLYADLEQRYGDFAGRLLISSHAFEEDWPTWEIHPKGDEFVVLISGDVEMVFATRRGEETVQMSEPGSFVVVPRGVWHTARVHERTQMLFVTPGEGTRNSEAPEINGD